MTPSDLTVALAHAATRISTLTADASAVVCVSQDSGPVLLHVATSDPIRALRLMGAADCQETERGSRCYRADLGRGVVVYARDSTRLQSEPGERVVL